MMKSHNQHHPKIEKIKTLYLKDIYIWYANKLVDENPQLYKKVYDSTIAIKGIYLVVNKHTNEVRISYTAFRYIINTCNNIFIDLVASGHSINLGFSLGRVEAAKVERSFNRKVCDFQATDKLRKENPGSKVIVYRTEDHYCKVNWRKWIRDLQNSEFYKLTIPKDFQRRFSNYIFDNPTVTENYVQLKERQ